MAIDIRVLSLQRDLQVERQIGASTRAATLLVAHDHGEFELTIAVDRWSSNPEEWNQALRSALSRFAQELVEASIQPLPSPKPPRSEAE